jgi:alkanesulfonate monooxygenase SsuD/methylene tetrahydromethanopterin reductase-like flavin-dependent oxidoreductase (luciferase family)
MPTVRRRPALPHFPRLGAGAANPPYDRCGVKTDLVLPPFDAALDDLIAAARLADFGGFDTVWTYDHFSGLVNAKQWSRDPFVTLGAIAATTDRVNLGILVANANNRHPAQLACAINSLQSLAPGRVLLGIGAGTSPRSQWSAEHAAIGRPLAAAATRRAVLTETIGALRALWDGEPFAGEHITVAASMAVTDGGPMPPVIVGASSTATIEVACAEADGVNLLPGTDLADRVAFARAHSADGFEISVFDALDIDHPMGGDPEPVATLGVQRRALYVAAPYPLDRIAAIAGELEPGA